MEAEKPSITEIVNLQHFSSKLRKIYDLLLSDDAEKIVVETANEIYKNVFSFLSSKNDYSMATFISTTVPLFLTLYNPNPKETRRIWSKIFKKKGLNVREEDIVADWRTGLVLAGQTAYADLDGIHITQYFIKDYLLLKEIDREYMERYRSISEALSMNLLTPISDIGKYPLAITYAISTILHEALHILFNHTFKTHVVYRNNKLRHGTRGANLSFTVMNIVADLIVNSIVYKYLEKNGLIDTVRQVIKYLRENYGEAYVSIIADSILNFNAFNMDKIKNTSYILTGDENFVVEKGFEETIEKFVEDAVNGLVEVKAEASMTSILGIERKQEIDVENELFTDYFRKGYTMISITLKRGDKKDTFYIFNPLNNESEATPAEGRGDEDTSGAQGEGRVERQILINKVRDKRLKKWLEMKKKARGSAKPVDVRNAMEELDNVRLRVSEKKAGIGAILSEIYDMLQVGATKYEVPWESDFLNYIRGDLHILSTKYSFNPPDMRYSMRLRRSVAYYKMKRQHASTPNVLLLIDISGSMLNEEDLEKIFKIIRDSYDVVHGVKTYVFWWMSGYAGFEGRLEEVYDKFFEDEETVKIRLPGTGGTEIYPVIKSLLDIDSGKLPEPVNEREGYVTELSEVEDLSLRRSIAVIITDTEIFDLNRPETISALKDFASRLHRLYWLTTHSIPEIDDNEFKKMIVDEKIKIYRVKKDRIEELRKRI